MNVFNVNDGSSKFLFQLEKNNKIEIIDVNNTNEYILLVESLPDSAFIGSSTASNYKMNRLSLYEISTGKHAVIQKPNLFNVVFDAKFED